MTDVCTTRDDLLKIKTNTVSIGECSIINSKIVFKGKDNKLTMENDVKIVNSTINFYGNSAEVYISQSIHEQKIDISVYSDNIVYIGKNNYYNGILHIVASERESIFIGDDNLFSYGITMRTADPHLLYDIHSKKRINNSKSIVIGDHVWIGQDVLILKGSFIPSGCVIGAKSTVTGSKKIKSNEIWAGNPVKCIRKDVFWSGQCVHNWKRSDSEKFTTRECDKYIYKNENNYLTISTIDIETMKNNNNHNRFSS